MNSNYKLTALPLACMAWLGVLTALPNPALSYERRVLLEDFTSTTCGPCAGLAPYLHQAIGEVGETVVPIAIHVWWPAPGDDPWCADNRSDSETRANYYPPVLNQGVPYLALDGTTLNARTRNAIVSAINDRASDESPIELKLSATIMDNVLHANVTVTSNTDLSSLTLQVALNELYYYYRGPAGQNDHYDAMVKMIPDADGTAFRIDADATLQFDFEQDMTGLGWHELEIGNLELIAWVQGSNREVKQAQSASLISINEMTLAEYGGDNDTRIEPSESGEIVLAVDNPDEYLMADFMEFTLATDDPGITITNETASVQQDDQNQTVTNADDPLTFEVADDFSAHPVTFTVTINVNDVGASFEIPITPMIGWPQVLVVNGTDLELADQRVYSVFGVGELPYADQLSRFDDVITADLLSNYRVLLWHTFNYQDPMSDLELEVLTDFLDHNGILIVSGSYIANELTGTDLMDDYLGARVEQADTRYSYVKGPAGNAIFNGTSIFLGSREAEDFADMTPVISAQNGAQPILNYERNTANMGVAGVIHDTQTYHTLLLSFPIESVRGFSGTDSIKVFMGRIWNWVDAALTVSNEPGNSPLQFSLAPAYPNPFNAQTVIGFTLPRADQTVVELYDLAGRRVASLFDGAAVAGEHRILLDAGTIPMISGMYLVKLSSGSETGSRKLVYIR